MWVLLIYIWFDTIHGVQSGIIRGLNLQFRGAILTLVCYYILGMPLALVFAFICKWGIMGLWAGFTIACVILDVGLFMIIYIPDWHKISEKVKEALMASQHNATNAVSYYRMHMTPAGKRKEPFFKVDQQRVYTILQHNRKRLDDMSNAKNMKQLKPKIGGSAQRAAEDKGC